MMQLPHPFLEPDNENLKNNKTVANPAMLQQKKWAPVVAMHYVRPKAWQFMLEQEALLAPYMASAGFDAPLPKHFADAPQHYQSWEVRRAAMWRYREERYAAFMADAPLREASEALYRHNILAWMRDFAWSYDPRPPRRGEVRQQGRLPMVLYPYQVETILRLNEAIERGEDILIEKSRDMGLSWLVCLVFQYRWLYHPGQQFLVGSRNHAFADTKGDIASLMEKCRYILRELPPCMLPLGFEWRKHDVGGKLQHPVNGNLITAEAATENFARGGRYTAILLDEFAFWPVSDASYASAGQATYCRITVSTPDGKQNRFYRERQSGYTPIITLHWVLHPFKDEAWYTEQCKRLLRHEIARELDIDYDHSRADRVFEEFEEYHVAPTTFNPALPLVRVWDFGYHAPAVLFMQVDAHGRLVVLHEEVGHRIVLKTFVEQVLQAGIRRFGEAGVRYVDYCDVAGKQHNDKVEFTSIDVLESYKIFPTPVRCPVTESIERVRHLMIEDRQLPLAVAQHEAELRHADLPKAVGKLREEEAKRVETRLETMLELPAFPSSPPSTKPDDDARLEGYTTYLEGLRTQHPEGLPEDRIVLARLVESGLGYHVLDGRILTFQPALQVDAAHCPLLLDSLRGGYRYPSSAHETPLQEHPFEDVIDCLRYGVWALTRVLPAQSSWLLETEKARITRLEVQARNRYFQQQHRHRRGG
jgi:hypothetical protein